MTRQEFSKATRRHAFVRAGGHCEEMSCRIKLRYGEAEYHHAKEDFLGGEATLENCIVLCRHCHTNRTKERRAAIDKTRRLSDDRMGIRKLSKWQTKWRKKVSGEVVLR